MSDLTLEQFKTLIESNVYWYGDDIITLPYVVNFNSVSLDKRDYLLVDFCLGSVDLVISMCDRLCLDDQLATLEEYDVVCIPSLDGDAYWIKIGGRFSYLDSIILFDVDVEMEDFA